MEKLTPEYTGEERREDHDLRDVINELKEEGIDTKTIEVMVDQGYVNMSPEEINEKEELRKKLAAAYDMPENTHWDVLMEKVKGILDRNQEE